MAFHRVYPGSALPAASDTTWILVQGSNIVLHMHNGKLQLPAMDAVESLLPVGAAQLHIANDAGAACFAATLPGDMALPSGFRAIGLRDLYGRVSDDAFALAGYAAQLSRWHASSNYCMRCGAPLTAMSTEWGKRCSDEACKWSMYPPVNPCTITLIHDGERALLTHKEGFGSRYGLVAGFVEPGESLEDNLHREVGEEVGVQVKNLRYFDSQPWPFPHQIMVGFFAEYDGGEIAIDTHELDDARWFHIDALPDIPPPLSIARRLINAWAATHGRDTTQLPMQ